MALLAAVACTPELAVSGEWGLYLDPEGKLTADSLLGDRADSLFADTIVLPGTTDLAGKGPAPTDTALTTRLSRRHAYVGKAWYR